jgi:hypothetical protein
MLTSFKMYLVSYKFWGVHSSHCSDCGLLGGDYLVSRSLKNVP